MTTDRFTPQDAAYAAGLSVRRLTHLGKHPDIQLDADSDRADGKVRRYSTADIVALALLDAARNAGWTPRRSRALLAPAPRFTHPNRGAGKRGAGR